jgi:hypothetical protein
MEIFGLSLFPLKKDTRWLKRSRPVPNERLKAGVVATVRVFGGATAPGLRVKFLPAEAKIHEPQPTEAAPYRQVDLSPIQY